MGKDIAVTICSSQYNLERIPHPIPAIPALMVGNLCRWWFM